MTRRNRKSNEPNKFQSLPRPMKRKKPLNLDCMRAIEPLTGNQEKLFNSYDEGKHLVAYGCAGTGKAQPLYSKVLTPSGWTTIGDIKVGDEVLTPEGKTTKVIGVFPQGEKEIYEVVFRDGSSARACLEHLWKVYVPYSWTRKKTTPPKIVDTQFLIDFLNTKKARNSNHNISIDLIEPIDTPNVDLPIDPYILGCLIGDGCLVIETPRITSADYEIIENIKNNLNEDLKINKLKSKKYDYSFVNRIFQTNKKNILRSQLENLSLYNKKSYEKEIPEIYMNSGLEQKMELIRGLLDTDGTVDRKLSSQVSYSTSSKKLAEQLQQLVWSIGGLCSITEKYPKYTYNGESKDGRISYRVWIKIRNNKELFKLTRKKELCRSTFDPIQYRRKIKEVNYVGKEEAKCIMIEDKNHLYITDDYTITHNTFISLYKALKEVLNENTPYEKVYICRSIVATREPGALPGDLGEKTGVFEIPYKNMVKYMFEMPDDPTFEMLYSNLKHQNTIEFLTTSFIRGVTLDRCIIIVDEFQNANFHELCSIITRVGVDTKIMFCGDATQSDFIKTSEKNGIIDFMRILQTMPSFDIIEFNIEDVVRSGLCKEFLIAKDALGL